MKHSQIDHAVARTVRNMIVARRRNRALDVAIHQIAGLPHHLRQDLLHPPRQINHNSKSISSNTFVCVITSSGAIFSS